MSSRLTMAVPLVAAVLAASCGYTVGYKKAGPVASAKSVSIPIFLNLTHESGMERIFTDSLRKEFSLDPSADMEGRSDAELLVTGTLELLQSAPVSFLSGQTVISIGEYIVKASVVIEARLRGKPDPVYRGKFFGEEQYLSANEPVGTESNRRLAIMRLAQKMMRDAHELMTSGF